MQNEFGGKIVAGLTGGSAAWSPQLLDQLYTASEDALNSRQQTRQLLIEEQD